MLVGNRSKDEVDTSEITSLLSQFPANTNVLVVDTNFTSLLNMKRIMRKYAYQVTIEADAEKALAFLTSCKHDINIVIWDYHMPEIDGVQALKSISSKMDLPVIIMSDENQTESVMKATVYGACDYVLKPVKEDVIANIWQHIVRKKLMSKPDVSTPVQSVLAQYDCFEQGKVDSKFVDQEQNMDKKEEREANRPWPTWTGEIQPVQSDLVQINVLDQHNEYSITINQDNGEQYIGEKIEGAAKGPWTGEIQPVQLDLVQISNVLDKRNNYYKTMNQDNGEQNIDKNEEIVETRPWMIWTGATQPFQSDLVQINDLVQHNYYSKTITQDKGKRSIDKKYEKAAKRMRADEIQLVQTDDSNNGNSVEIIDERAWKKTRKPRMKWTKDLHNKFLEAIEIIGGIQNANPKVLLECLQGMKIQGLTKSKVASHLQKHRIYLDEEQIPQQTQKIGWSTEYGAAPSLQGLSNVHTCISPYLTNGQAVNPIQQNQYQNGAVNPIKQNQYQSGAVNPLFQQNDQYHNGYLTMNKNPFMTNPLPHVPYIDHQPRQPQQQQYQSSPQYNYLLSNEEPGKASDIYAPHLELPYPSLPYM